MEKEGLKLRLSEIQVDTEGFSWGDLCVLSPLILRGLDGCQ